MNFRKYSDIAINQLLFYINGCTPFKLSNRTSSPNPIPNLPTESQVSKITRQGKADINLFSGEDLKGREAVGGWQTILRRYLVHQNQERQQNNMSYKILLIALLFIGIGQAYSDLTMLNCPAQFDVAASNITTSNAAATLGAFVYAGFQSPSSQARVQGIVINGNTKDLSKYMSQMMIPYVIFGVIYLILYLGIVICCLFERSCPPCESIRRNLDENPYSKRQTRAAMFFTLVFAIGIFIVCMIAMSFIPDAREQATLSSCSFYLALDTVINGDGTWGGIINLRDTVGNITNLLSAAGTQIQIYFPGDSWLMDSMQAMQTANLNIYTNFKNSQLVTPNPDTTSTATNAGQSTPMIDSLFIKYGMGPNGTSNTMASDIDAGLRATKKLSDLAYGITQSAALLTQSLGTILNNSQTSQNTLLMYIHQLDVVVTEYEVINQNYFGGYFGNFLSAFEGIYAFVLTGSLLALLGVIAAHVFDVFTCRSMVHLGWTVFGLAYVGIIGLTFILLSVGSIGYGFCNYFHLMLTDQTAYAQLGASYTQNAFTRIDTCIFGDGNSLSKFNLNHEMGTVEQLFTNIQTYNDYTNVVSQNYVNLAISSNKITGWVNAMENYRLGIYIDSDVAITSSDNPNFAINQLNLYTYTGGGVPTGSKDVWVWDKANCTDPNQITYTSTTSAGTTFNTSQVTCLSFNEKLISTSSNSWSFSDFTMRYVQIRQSYPTAYNKTLSYGATLIAFRDSRLNLFKAIKDKLSALLTLNNNFNSMLGSFNTRVSQFYSAVSTLNNLITNTLNGLIVSSNCKSISGKLWFSYNVFCVNFMGQIVKLCLCCIILLILMLGGILAGSRFGMIYAQAEKVKRINMPEEAQSQKDIHMQHNDSTSSNSNDDD